MTQPNSNFNNFFAPPSNRWGNSSEFEEKFRREAGKKIRVIQEYLQMLEDVIFDLKQELDEFHQMQREEVTYE